MAWHDNIGAHFLGTSNGRVEVVDLKPQEHSVSVRLKIRIPDGAMMMLHFPFMQLKDQPAMGNEALILGAAVRTLTAKQMLKPATARLDVLYANEWLWMHKNFVA
jgi:hypothetical protein